MTPMSYFQTKFQTLREEVFEHRYALIPVTLSLDFFLVPKYGLIKVSLFC